MSISLEALLIHVRQIFEEKLDRFVMEDSQRLQAVFKVNGLNETKA